jgi:hypothetical protein
VVKLETREVAYHGSHAVLYIKEVGFDVGIDEALEQGTIKQGEVAIRTKTSRWQLVGISNQQHLLHPTLKSNQQICLSRLSSLVNNQAGDLPTQTIQLLVPRTTQSCQHDLCLFQKISLDLVVKFARSHHLLTFESI